MIKIKDLGKEGNEIKFIIKDINPALANTLRRIIIEEVPVMAIKEINFVKNDSALYDEIIAHRIGLIPFITDLKSYFLPDKCKCDGKGCARCQLKMTLKVKGPATVYASDIKTRDSKIKPVYPKTPITKLLKNQEIEAELIATLGYGKDHSKYTPGLIYYQGCPEIKLKGTTDKKIHDVCPTKVFKMQGNKVVIDDELKCILCGACEDISEDVKIRASDTDFIFRLESWGQLKPKEILLEALNILDSKLSDFSKSLKKIK